MNERISRVDSAYPRCRDLINVRRLACPVTVLGPGRRAVIWVQGCSLRCEGCIVPESWDGKTENMLCVQECAEWLRTQSGIEGVTLSGGEPMEQASALSSLLLLMRENSDLGVVCYTGYTLEMIELRGTDEQKQLLSLVDLLIDGPYVKALHTDLLWRASSNQRLLPLSARYRALIADIVESQNDRSSGLEMTLGPNGAVGFIGVPPLPAFREEFKSRMIDRDIRFEVTRESK